LQYEAPTLEVVAVEDDSIDSIGDAFRAGLDVFVGVLFAAGLVVAVAAPFLVAAMLVLGVIWLATRRRRARNVDSSSATPTTAPISEMPAAVTNDEQLAGPSPRG
jgi:Flp pilus assembly protein TadB